MTKIRICDKNIQFLNKIPMFDRCLTKVSIFDKKIRFCDQSFEFSQKVRFLMKISIFDQKYRFWKVSIFDKNFDFGQKFQFLMKISIFDNNFDFWQKFDSWPNVPGPYQSVLNLFENPSAAQNLGHNLRYEWSWISKKLKESIGGINP